MAQGETRARWIRTKLCHCFFLVFFFVLFFYMQLKEQDIVAEEAEWRGTEVAAAAAAATLWLYPTAVSYGFRVNNLVCLTTTALPLCYCPYPHPQPTSTRLPRSPLPSPWFLLSLFTFAMLAKCFAGPHGSQIRPSKSDNAGSESTLACQLIPIVDCFKQKKGGNRIWREAQGELKRGGEVGNSFHGELFISSTFTYSDLLSGLCLDPRQCMYHF